MEHDPETHDALASAVRDALEVNPQLTINLLASQLDSTVDDVSLVLDQYFCQSDCIEYLGPGQGGNWVPVEQQQANYNAQPEPEHIGYRWPDASIREVQFDIENPEHRAEMGIPDPDA